MNICIYMYKSVGSQSVNGNGSRFRIDCPSVMVIFFGIICVAAGRHVAMNPSNNTDQLLRTYYSYNALLSIII